MSSLSPLGLPGSALSSPIAHEFLSTGSTCPANYVAADIRGSRCIRRPWVRSAKVNGVGFRGLVDAVGVRSDLAHRREGECQSDDQRHPLTRRVTRRVAAITFTAYFRGGDRTFLQDKSGKGWKINAAIRDKNFYWFNRYRVTDGYSTYGDRAFLKFARRPRRVWRRACRITPSANANSKSST